MEANSAVKPRENVNSSLPSTINVKEETESLGQHSSSESKATADNDVEKGIPAHAVDTSTNSPSDDLKAEDEDENEDPNVVWWDGPDDPENPLNWSNKKKLINSIPISLLNFIEPLASSVFAPGIPLVMMEFQSSNTELAALTLSIYVLGFAVGPLVLAPMSEVIGRVPVYHACNVMFIGFTIACAKAPSLGALIAFRFLAGTFGSAPLTNGGGSIADMFAAEQRASVMAAFSIGPLVGPIIGPVIGGFLTEAEGWRWDFWLVAIVAGTITLTMFVVSRESFSPLILERKVRRLRKETGNQNLRSKLDTGRNSTELFKHSIVRPSKLLITSPLTSIFAVFLGICYGYLYLLFTSVNFVFEERYNFSTKEVGLVYLALGIGCIIGMVAFAWDSNAEVKRSVERGDLKPEVRLKLLPAGSIIFPIGFFIYGWTAEHHTHWMGPIIGLVIIGIGNLLCFMTVCVYLVDAYDLYSASALAANTVIRSIAGALLPLCGLRMYNKLGLGWGNTMLGLIAVPLIPVSFLIQRYGEKIRTKYVIKDI